MLWVILIVAVMLWLIGLIVSVVTGGLLTLLLGVAAFGVIWGLLKRGRQRAV